VIVKSDPLLHQDEVRSGVMKIRPLYDRTLVVKRIEQYTWIHRRFNLMKIRPLYGIVVYIPDIPDAKEKPQEGEVVAVGKGKRLEDGKVVRSMCRLATGSCSASTPAATSRWMATSI
jgi:co-chaperonin GroES (HSP10)